MKNIIFTTLTLLLCAASLGIASSVYAQTTDPSALPAGEYQLDKTHASLTWKVSHMGLSNYTARFTDFDATIDYDPNDLENSTLTVSVDPRSLETDYPNPEEEDFDEKLITSEDWFNAGEFPQIEFISTSITRTGENTGEVTGDLTFMGVTKPLTLDVTFNGAYESHPFSQKPAMGFSAHGTLVRSEWGMDNYVPNIGDEVELLIETEFVMESGNPDQNTNE